jgi:iron complex outermembrane recepter protein
MKTLLHGVALAALTLYSQAAHAQGVVPTPAAPDAAQPAGTDSATVPGDDGGSPDIIVTATRRETPLQRTPLAITVVDEQMIRDRHIQSLYDFADGAVPSLRVATFEARQSALTVGIRGIVPLDANQPAREQGVGIYLDGVYLGRQHGLNAALFDIQRIEVLRGPQGTLFGRNTEGGALNIVTRPPTGEFGGRVVGGFGNYGSYNGEIHLDLPELHNFRVKLDGVVQHQDATTEDPLPGSTGWNYYDRHAFRGELQWHDPSERFTADFAYDNGYDANTPFYSQLLNYNPNNCAAGTQASQPACTLPGTAYTNLTGTVRPLLPGVQVVGDRRMDVADIGVPQQPSIDRTEGYTFHLTYHASPAFELRSITAWRSVDVNQWDNSGGAHRVPVVNLTAACTQAAPCAFSRYSLADLYQTQFSQEFQAVGTIGSVDYVAGLYFFNEHVADDAATPNSNAVYLNGAGQPVYTILDPCTGSGGFGSIPGCRSIDRASQVRSRSYAAYANITWNVSDSLHLTVGGRYTHDDKQGQLVISRNLIYVDTPFARSIFATNLPFTVNTAAATANGYHPLDETWNRFNPTVNLAYDFSDTVHGYARFATGYRAGGASSRTANYQAFGPEDVRNYEIGLKTDLFNRRLRLNLAAYAMDRDNTQVDISSIQPTATGNFNNLVTINSPGTSKIRGIEVEAIARPTENLTLTASYAYTDTKIPPVSITATAGGLSTTVSQQFYIVFTPRNAASGAIDYTLPIGGHGTNLRLHLDANYAQATQAFDQFGTKADSSFIVNGRLALADVSMGASGQRVTFSLWGRNLFDEQHVFRRDPSNSLPGAPTTSVTTGSVNNILGDYGNFNAPRTFGIEAAVSF